MNIHKKQFLKKLKSLSHRYSTHRVFSDWLEIAAITLHQLPYHSGDLTKDTAFEKLEQLYLEHIKPYHRDELNAFSELIGITIAAHHTGYGDFLGEIAGESELLNKGNGQFFTPYHVCCAIAKMLMGDVRQVLEQKELITACEPAVGAGGLVIASAEEMTSQGIDPRTCIQFDCTDISRDAFNMTYIQLCAQNLQAVVRHGNTLSMEYWEHRPTPQLRLFRQWLETQQRTQRLVQAMRSLLVDERTPVPEPSATLFDLDEFAVGNQTKQRRRCQPDIVLDQQLDLFIS